MQHKPHILIVNDDGIHAEGLWHLWKSLVNKADISIVAPHEEQSGAGMSLTLRTPLYATRVHQFEHTPAWHINGTPSTCVKMALNTLLDHPPDIVVSGINNGNNIGRNVLYSGTVGGVIEGIMHKIPGIAFSTDHYNRPNYALAARHIPCVVDYILKNPLNSGTLLNVNFPGDIDEIKGFKFTRQGLECWVEDIDERKHPTHGAPYYWLGATIATFEEADNSDSTYLHQGYMTATPIQVDDLTDNATFEKHEKEFEKTLLEKTSITADV